MRRPSGASLRYMTNVFVTRHIPSPGIELLCSMPNLVVDVFTEDRIIPRNELLARIAGANILLSILTDRIDAEVMDAAGPSLKMIANYGVGFDNIDVGAAKKRGIVVTNTPTPESNAAVAEHTIALMFAVAKRIIETDCLLRGGDYTGWGPERYLGTSLTGKTIGILGCGAIGSDVAKKMSRGFDARILYTDIQCNAALEKEMHAEFCSKEVLLHEADIVSVHVPLLPSTTHLINAPALATMKPSAILINTARGAVIDTAALVDALENNVIAGAGIDVFEGEPNLAHDPTVADRLRNLKNVVLTPHTGSATLSARTAMSRHVVKNIEEFLAGEVPENIVK